MSIILELTFFFSNISKILYKSDDLLSLSSDERAQNGIFLGFQYHVEIPGLNNSQFLKAALNAKRRYQGLD